MSKHVMFILGEPEYKSEVTMPAIARELEGKYNITTNVSICRVLSDRTDSPSHEFPDLEALADADLAVFYIRFRQMPDEQIARIKAYLDSGRPVVGLRTSSHAFRYPEDSKHHNWNDGFGQNVLGAPWRYHYGHESSTDVRIIPEVADHPILKGIPSEFHVRSWLYYVLPITDTCKPLLMGTSVGPSGREERVDNPVAWTNTHNGDRVFYTSMGHPDDFEAEAFQVLLTNGILWAVG
jgi:type 1 glutamine amidotransferase